MGIDSSERGGGRVKKASKVGGGGDSDDTFCSTCGQKNKSQWGWGIIISSTYMTDL